MLNARRPLCGFTNAFNSHLANDGEDSTVCEQQDQNFFWFFFRSVEILSSEKCCTVMHEAIVTQLHPQDQRLLPGSAVALHHKTRERESGCSGERWRVDESRGKKKRKRIRTKDIVCLDSSQNVTLTPPLLFLHPKAQRPAEPLHAPSWTQPKSCLDSIVWQLLKSHWSSESYSAGLGQTHSYGLPHTHTYALKCTHKHVLSAIDSAVVAIYISFLCCHPGQDYQSVNLKASCQSQ